MDVTAARVAVVIPCRNEETTVAGVVEQFRRYLPDAVIVVADNDSHDETARRAALAGAAVVHVARPGKSLAVRRLFADVDADGNASVRLFNDTSHLR